MHCEKLSACVFACCSSAESGPPPFGSRCWQAVWAAWTRELLAPSCCGVSLDLSNAPLLSGSGQFGTRWERMQPAKATAWSRSVEAAEELEDELLFAGLVVEPTCAT
jgi:hypothetical protein